MVVRQIRYIVTINVVIKIITYMSCIYLPTEKLGLSGTEISYPLQHCNRWFLQYLFG